MAPSNLTYVHTNFDAPIKLNGFVSDKENAGTMRAKYDF